MTGEPDGAAWTKTAPSTTNAATNSGATVKKVRQKGITLSLDLADNTTLTVQAAEATSSFLFQEQAGKQRLSFPRS